jgi:hypothetical protein
MALGEAVDQDKLGALAVAPFIDRELDPVGCGREGRRYVDRQCEMSSSDRLSVRGPMMPITNITPTIDRPMKVATPIVPPV